MKWNFIDIGHENWTEIDWTKWRSRRRKKKKKKIEIYPVKKYWVNYRTEIMIIPPLSDTYKSPFPFLYLLLLLFLLFLSLLSMSMSLSLSCSKLTVVAFEGWLFLSNFMMMTKKYWKYIFSHINYLKRFCPRMDS